MDYADDLDRFINGQIRLEDMQGYIKKILLSKSRLVVLYLM